MDIERTIEFLLEQQARFAERQGKHDERQEQFEADLSQVNGALMRTNEVLIEVANSQERTNEIVEVLAQKLVDLTTLVERHIAGHS
ncbi:MAG: hypothetical protein ACREDR_29310 [Blastocatellia bacterium]